MQGARLLVSSMMAVALTAQHGEHALQQQGQQVLDARASSRLPVEHVAEGYVLGRYPIIDADTTNFHTTGRYHTTGAPTFDGGTGLAQRAATEYQTLALMREERHVSPHRVDEYV